MVDSLWSGNASTAATWPPGFAGAPHICAVAAMTILITGMGTGAQEQADVP